MLDRCIRKLNEVAQDLREPQDGASLEHQAQKLDAVRGELEAIRGLLLEDGPINPVHGGGTGRD